MLECPRFGTEVRICPVSGLSTLQVGTVCLEEVCKVILVFLACSVCQSVYEHETSSYSQCPVDPRGPDPDQGACPFAKPKAKAVADAS